jgi:hypothetical protein
VGRNFSGMLKYLEQGLLINTRQCEEYLQINSNRAQSRDFGSRWYLRHFLYAERARARVERLLAFE